MTDSIHRREWLNPRHLGNAAGQIVGAMASMAAPEPTNTKAPEFSPEVALVHYRHAAMATQFELVLPFGHGVGLDLADTAFATIDDVESLLSVYRESSPVSEINRSAFAGSVTVPPQLFELLARCVRLHEVTERAFDVAIGTLIRAWGFHRGPPRVPSPDELAVAKDNAGMQWLSLDHATRSVRLLRPGVQLNFGSVGKGFALDAAADRLQIDHGVTAALLHGGRSSVYALGCQPGDPLGWPVGVAHPWDTNRRLAVVYLRDQGLGTSAATYKHLVHNGRKLGHLLDPRTGWPASGVASASAMAPSAADADALATAFFVQGPEFTARFCRAFPDIGAVLLLDGADEVQCYGQAVSLTAVP